MSTRRFLDVLFNGCDHGVVELRALPSAHRTFAPVGAWPSFGPFITNEVRNEQNVYAGIATRRDDSSGTASNLAELSVLWVDFDVPPADVRTRLIDFPFRWTLFVASGYGAHVYWRLREPLNLTDSRELAHAASLLRRLCAYLQGDEAATDPARILRVPGTFNFKYGEPRPVTLVAHTDATVDVSELAEFLPREALRQRQRVLEAAITPGARNDVLFGTARSLRAKGLPAAAIMQTIETLNRTQCDPPLDDREIRTLLHSALTQPDRPDFTRAAPPNGGSVPPAADEPSRGRCVVLQTVQPEPVDWLWPGWLPRQKGIVLAGDPGMGKSMLALDLAARVSAGRAWPTGEAMPPGRVLLLCAEDGLADTVRPRVDAAGGDARQIVVLTGVQQGTHDRLVNLATDLSVVEQVVTAHHPSLIVIDPLNAYLGQIDSYKDAEVRGLLAPLLELADRSSCVLLWIAHLTKDADRRALYRAGGSIAFVAAARVVLVVGEHPEQRDVRVVVQAKNNLAPRARGLTYRVDTGAVAWGESVSLQADDLLKGPFSARELERATTAADVLEALRAESTTGVIDVRDAFERAELVGIARRTMQHAAHRAGLVPYRQGHGAARRSVWFDTAVVPDTTRAKEVIDAEVAHDQAQDARRKGSGG